MKKVLSLLLFLPFLTSALAGNTITVKSGETSVFSFSEEATILITNTTPGTVLTRQEKTADLYVPADITYEIVKNQSDNVELTVTGLKKNDGEAMEDVKLSTSEGTLRFTDSTVVIPQSVFESNGKLAEAGIGTYNVTVTFTTNGETSSVTDKLTLKIKNSKPVPTAAKAEKTFDIYQVLSQGESSLDECETITVGNQNVKGIKFENINWNNAKELSEVSIANQTWEAVNATNVTDDAKVIVDSSAKTVFVKATALSELATATKLQKGESYDVVLVFKVPGETAGTTKYYTIDGRLTLKVIDTTSPKFGNTKTITYDKNTGDKGIFNVKQNTADSASVKLVKQQKSGGEEETKDVTLSATDVVLSNNQLIFTESYLKKLENGTYTYDVVFTDARKTKEEGITIEVTDSTPGTVETEQEKVIDMYDASDISFIVQMNSSTDVELKIKKVNGTEEKDVTLTVGLGKNEVDSTAILTLEPVEGSGNAKRVTIPKEAFTETNASLKDLTYGPHDVEAVFKKSGNADKTVTGKLTLKATSTEPDPVISLVQTGTYDIANSADVEFKNIVWNSATQIEKVYIDTTELNAASTSLSGIDSVYSVTNKSGNLKNGFLTIKKEALANLTSGDNAPLKAGESYPVKVVFTTNRAGKTGTCEIDSRLTLKVKTTSTPELQTTDEQTFDKNSDVNVSYTVNYNSATTAEVTAGVYDKENSNVGGTPVNPLPDNGADVKIDKNAIVLRNSYLKTLEPGHYIFTVTFDDENKTEESLKLEVYDTTPGTILTAQEKTVDMFDAKDVVYEIVKNQSTAVTVTVVDAVTEKDSTKHNINLPENTDSTNGIIKVDLQSSAIKIPKEMFGAGGALEGLYAG